MPTLRQYDPRLDSEVEEEIICGGAESCAGKSGECRLESRVSRELDKIMQDKIVLPDVAMRETARAYADDTIELASPRK